MLLVLGTLDPHIPEHDRHTLIMTLEQANITHKVLLYEAAHTFMRDDGYRYDSQASTSAWLEIVAFPSRVFPQQG